MQISTTYNCDCLEYMKTVPDKFFSLAVCDPPFGGGSSQNVQVERESLTAQNGLQAAPIGHGAKDGRFGNPGSIFEKYRQREDFSAEEIDVTRTGGTWAAKYGTRISDWDVAPTEEYFKELARISRNQIIFGGNYFNLPPTRCLFVWWKLTISDSFSMAMCEYAWTSFNMNAKYFECPPQGKKGDRRFHPTSKPIMLYDYIFKTFAKPGDKIFDSHLGSGSSRISAWKAGLDFIGCEIDPYYFKLEEERFERFRSQINLFVDGEEDW